MLNIQGDALRGHLDNLALSVLEQGPAHGLEVLRRLESAGCGALQLKEGTLYPVLYRLEEAGLLAAEWEDGSARHRGPRRRIYRLTPKGRRRLERGRAEWRHFIHIVGGILGATS